MSDVEIVTTQAPVEILVDRNGLSQAAVDRHVAAKHTRAALGLDILGATPIAGRLTEGGAGGVIQHANLAETVTGAVVTLTATLTANRAKTLRDADGTIAELQAAQTWTALQTMDLGSGALDAASRPSVLRLAADATAAVEVTGYGGGPEFVQRFSGGTRAAKTAPVAGNGIQLARHYFWDGTTFVQTAQIRSRVAATHSATEGGTDWRFGAVAPGDSTRTIVESVIVDAYGVQTITGTPSNPAYRAGDVASGLYRVSANVWGWSASGVQRMTFEATRLSINANTTTEIAALPAPPANTLLRLTGNNSSTTRFLSETYGGAPRHTFRRSEGTFASPSAVTAGLGIAEWSIQGYGATALSTEVVVEGIYTAELWTDAAQGTYREWRTTALGATASTARMRHHPSGGLKVGGTLASDPGTGQVFAEGFAGGTQTVSTTGTIAALDSSTQFGQMTGASPDVQGIAAPPAGARLIHRWFQNGGTIRHEHASAAAANRIASHTGGDIVVPAGRTVVFQYDPTAARYRTVTW